MNRIDRVRTLVLVLACGAATAQADSVSGKFEMDGQALAPKEVAAFRVRDQFSPREIQTYVMLTLLPVDKARISASTDPYTVAINDEAVKNDDYLSLHVDADGETSINAHVGGTQYIDSSGKIMGMKGSLVASCKENTPARIACSVKTEKPVKTKDGPSWSLDVSFESAISARAAGKPMPKNGGAPGKALMDLTTALKGNDLNKILALLDPETAKGYNEDWRTPEENLASAKDILSFRVPKQPKITGGEAFGEDYAVLEVEGVPYENGRMLYLVEMRLIEGRWVMENSSPAGMLR